MQVFLRLKSRCLLSTITFILIFAHSAFAQSSSDDDIHISAIAEFYALQVYPNAKGHKAIAIGPGGYWNEATGKPSAAAASKYALAGCVAALRRAPFKSLAKRNCVLFDVDGRRTGKATPIGIPFATAAPGEDLPFAKGRTWEPTGSTRRGILLLLHGCNRLEGLSGWVTSLVNYYRASGFRVVMPDSFAEPRDPETCSAPGETGIDRQTRILKLRVAQTLRTLATLSHQYPGEAIYVHGHSEGGYIAQALGQKVDGIIVTGAACGFGYSAAYWSAEGTPILVVAGTRDPLVPGARNAKAFASYCKKVRGAGKLRTVVVSDMGHFAALWQLGMREAVAKFLGIAPIAITRRDPKGVKLPALPPADLEQYRAAASPKAMAADEHGNSAWYQAAESKLDAEEMALFDCDGKAGADPYADSAHRHSCVLVDVNGKPPVK
ncbi:alpha/beta hydrolase [Taklimakanibacter lacteus]|uniref:alpha/beta hydrolase n=1 Tax=Taklimakanibacter lacteus TaxID=2268456 RepID=UPI000E65F540